MAFKLPNFSIFPNETHLISVFEQIKDMLIDLNFPKTLPLHFIDPILNQNFFLSNEKSHQEKYVKSFKEEANLGKEFFNKHILNS